MLSRNNSQIICDMNVVRFFKLVEANNLTVEGWKAGDGYYCEDDKNNKHEIKTYREYFNFHDLEAVFSNHSMFSEVGLGKNQEIQTKPDFRESLSASQLWA